MAIYPTLFPQPWLSEGQITDGQITGEGQITDAGLWEKAGSRESLAVSRNGTEQFVSSPPPAPPEIDLCFSCLADHTGSALRPEHFNKVSTQKEGLHLPVV